MLDVQDIFSGPQLTIRINFCYPFDAQHHKKQNCLGGGSLEPCSVPIKNKIINIYIYIYHSTDASRHIMSIWYMSWRLPSRRGAQDTQAATHHTHAHTHASLFRCPETPRTPRFQLVLSSFPKPPGHKLASQAHIFLCLLAPLGTSVHLNPTRTT